MIVAGYYGFTLEDCLSTHPSCIHPLVCISFRDDSTSKHQWILTKLGMCIDIVEIWFEIANGHILSNFDGAICPRQACIFISEQ